MKRLTKLLLLFTLVGVLTGGCELLKNAVKFDSDTYYYDFTINPTEAGVYTFDESVITTGVNQILDDNNVKREKLKSATITEIVAEIQSEHTFDILDDGVVYIQAGKLSKIALAHWPSPVPASSKSVALDANSANFKDYILEDSFTLSGEATLNSALTSQAIVRVWFSFELEAKIIGK
jgi:hypothetical protein